MQLEWVKQQLLRRGTATAKGSSAVLRNRSSTSPSTSSKSSAYVIAERMDPFGCSCVLVGPRGRNHTAPPSSAFHEPSTLASAPSSSAPSSADASRTDAAAQLVRHRVTLPGITPGTVLRTRSSVVAWMRRTRQLPAAEQYTVIMQHGRRVPVSRQQSAAATLPALPCPCASSGTCGRCPWMALQERQQTSSTKAKAWRTGLLASVRNHWTAAGGAFKTSPKHTKNEKDQPQTATQTYTQVMRCFAFLEAMTVPVPPNKLQALQLIFHPRREETGANYVLSTNSATTGGATPASDRSGVAADGKITPLVELLREGDSGDNAHMQGGVLLDVENTNGTASRGGASSQDSCLLETLEQKRLVTFLRRWAAELPTSMQQRLRGVFISQPSSAAPRRTFFSAEGESLQVILLVAHNDEVLGMQSPLCGPTHPGDVLSAEEQQLVACVTAAAPLLANIEVLVCVSKQASECATTGAAAAEVDVHVLYPKLSRGHSIEQLHQCEKEHAAGAGKTKSCLVSSALTVRCWCEPLRRELKARLSPYHAALAVADPQMWLSAMNGASNFEKSGGASAKSAVPFQKSHRSHCCSSCVPWVPTFWRHPAALDMCCSVLVSMLLESADVQSANAAAAADVKARMSDVTWSSPFENMTSAVKVCALKRSSCSSTDPAVFGAFVGQLLLDSSLQSLLNTALSRMRTAPDDCAKALQDDMRSAAAAPLSFLISVNDYSENANVAACLNSALSTSSACAVRLCLYTCTATMQTERLGAHVSAVVHQCLSRRHAVQVRTGVVDVDPLSSSFVAYAFIDITR